MTIAEDKALAVHDEHRAVAAELTVEQVIAQAEKVQALVAKAMRKGHHYGEIPGTAKPTLLKPGAEKICFMFRVAPEFRVTEKELPGNHREYQVLCELVHMASGAVVGHGVGACSTMESKYRYRWARKKCPACGAEAIIQVKSGLWICFSRKGGCGAKFKATDQRITGQVGGRIENPDIADTYNTVLKMAKKRSLVDATLTAFAVSDSFDQDLEESEGEDISRPPRKRQAAAGDGQGGGENADAEKRKPLIERIAAGMKSGLFAKGEVDLYRKQVASCPIEKLPELVAEVEAEVERRKARDAKANEEAAAKGFDQPPRPTKENPYAGKRPGEYVGD